MPFEKGNKLQVPRKKPNKGKRRFKVALQDMFENNADNIAGWLDEIAKEDPAEALNQLNKWMEFCYPKLARVENKHEGEVDVNINEIARLVDEADKSRQADSDSKDVES